MKKINGRLVIMTWVVFILCFYLINASPIGQRGLTKITGVKTSLGMNMRGYTVEEAYESLEVLGDEGRAFLLRYIMPLDILFPLAYGICFMVTLIWLYKRILKNRYSGWIGILGIFCILFDYLENWQFYKMIVAYPTRLVAVTTLANTFTRLKWVFNMMSMSLILLGGVFLVVRSIRQKRV